MKTAIVIPARMGSTRFPGKPLTMLRGANGAAKSLAQRCWETARLIPADHHIFATDHAEIYDHVRGFGGTVMMTSDTARNGTERVAEIAREVDADIFVNFQGDAPLIPPEFVTALIAHMQSGAAIATPVMPCDAEMLANIRGERAAGRVGGTTAVTDQDGRALYFSKEVIPFADALDDPAQVRLHIGLYAYAREVLAQYPNWPSGPLEGIEGLEQLRFLENGHKIDCVEVVALGRGFWEVNNPEDVPIVEAALKERGIE